MRTTPASGTIRLALAGGLVLLLTAGITAAAYFDEATLNLGGTGIGNPNTFDIAVHDQGNALQDAKTPASAVVLTTSGSSAFTVDTPVIFDVTVTNRTTSLKGSIVPVLYDPDPVTDDLFAKLRFSLYLDGSTSPVATGATADELNALGTAFVDVAAGKEHTVRLSVVLATGTGFAYSGKTTQLGVRMDGESTP
ncbi:hypothetical protein [Luethyella okanaganae]|uniref:Ribosomally synthesized peptide with SipW-like signal peptide n=1 Tax=Luethyella okanaganae TaxID=69372 RepID=A0ABW1VHZ7_9MICO